MSAAAIAVLEDLDWPVQGRVQSTDVAGVKIVLNRTSPNFHAGMYLVFAPYDPDENYDSATFACVEKVEGNVAYLDAPLGRDVSGSPFFTLPRATPDSLTDFNRMDCINLLQGMHEEIKSEELLESREKRLQALFATSEDDGSAEAMRKAWVSCSRNMAVLEERCHAYNILTGKDPLSVMCAKLLNDIRTIQKCIFESEWAERNFRSAAHTGAGSDKFINLWNFDKSPDDKKSDYTELVEHFLKVATQQHLRHKGKIVYERIMTVVDKWKPLPDNPICERHGCENLACFAPQHTMERQRCVDHRLPGDVDCRLVADDESKPHVLRMREDERTSTMVHTRAWKPMMQHGSVVDIRRWMHMNVDQHSQPALWNKFFEFYGKGVATCESYMSIADNALFPLYQPDPKMFGFQNGIYDVRTNRFYQYLVDSVPDVCCVNHLEMYFDPAWTTMDVHDLAVPGYDDIVASQDYDEDMRTWLDVFLGRLFFSVGELDNWEKFLVIKGWAATGKSTIAKAISTLFGASNVGNIPANCEEQWALASVHDKLVWMCTELKKDWRFPTAVLQSMISGEVVPVHVKNQTAVDIDWKIPGFAVGNEEPVAWVNDPGNALFRRVIPMPFDMTPKFQDPTVQKRFMASIGRFLVRVTRQYVFKTTYEVREASVDQHLPRRLKEARAQFLHRTQPLIRFLQETPDFVLAPEDIREMINPPHHGADALGPATAAASMRSVVTPGGVAETKQQWRVLMSEVNSKFKEWWHQNNLGKNPPSIVTKTVYDVAVRHLNISVERDETDRRDYMYGVKPVTAIRNNGYQGVSFAQTAAT